MQEVPVLSTPMRMQKFKKWAHDHQDDIIGASVVITAVGGFVAFVVAATKHENRQIATRNQYVREMNTWLNDEQNSGNVVYPLIDGRYLVVPNTAPQETVIK